MTATEMGAAPHVLTFDRLRRVLGFGEFGFAVFESEEQFRPLVLQLAEETLAAAAEDQQHFQSIEQTAAALVHEQEQQDIAQAGWPAFHAGAAAVMAGRFDDAFRMLESVIQPQARQAAGQLLAKGSEPALLRNAVRSMVDLERGQFGFPPLGD